MLLEDTLEEVTSGGGTETSPDGASTLVGDDLAEAANETAVVGDGVKLDAGLDAAWLLAGFSLTRHLRAAVAHRRKNFAAAIGAHHGGGRRTHRRGSGHRG